MAPLKRIVLLLLKYAEVKVKEYNKTLNVKSLGKLVSFVFPQVLMFPKTNKTNCLPRDLTLMYNITLLHKITSIT